MSSIKFAKSTKIARENSLNITINLVQKLQELFPNVNIASMGFEPLGYVGKVDSTNDLDLAIDQTKMSYENWKEDLNNFDSSLYSSYLEKFTKRARTATKEELSQRAVLACIADILRDNGYEVYNKILSTNLVFEFPYKANGEVLYAQIDLKIGDIEWMKFIMRSNHDENPFYRTHLFASLFIEGDFKFCQYRGFKTNYDLEWISDTKRASKILGYQVYNTENSFEKMSEFLLEDRGFTTNHEINSVKKFLKVLDSSHNDIPNAYQELYIENIEELGLKGKFLPKNSALYFLMRHLRNA